MTFTSAWRSPSNIALIKYWGKHGLQLPRNPSLSFTLSACHTVMRLAVTPDADSPGLQVSYDGVPKQSFEPKIKTFFSLVEERFPWLSKASVTIDSHNTFPHGAGIASSASAMSALSLCLMDIHDQIHGGIVPQNSEWWQTASEVARLGSGSACRSVYPVASIWGQTPNAPESSDFFGIPWEHEIAPVFKDYRDTILIVSTAEKSVSSTAGHCLMEGLSYAEARFAEARQNLIRLSEVMATGTDLNAFIAIVESEALQLHALMMSGKTPFILMEPGTISLIKEIWRFRKETGIPVCFTLDAGPNVHLLYPNEHSPAVMHWVNSNLTPYCAQGKSIPDQVGTGPEKIS
jgi:diphosphomevalonate decarboxylase